MISVTKLLFMDEYYGDSLRYGHHAHRMRNGAADGMGPVVVWNSTRTCNLRCRHCYMASDGQRYEGELTMQKRTAFARRFRRMGRSSRAMWRSASRRSASAMSAYRSTDLRM